MAMLEVRDVKKTFFPGTPDEVRRHPAVVRSYLGVESADSAAVLRSGPHPPHARSTESTIFIGGQEDEHPVPTVTRP